MRWPRSALRMAYEDMRDERDRLLTLVERYAEREYRLARREAGMPEREAEAAPKVMLTRAILEACDKWGSSSGAQRRAAEQMLRAGKGEAEVVQAISAGDPA